MLMATGAFGNTTFLGYPIAQSILPHSFPSAVILDQFGMVLPMFIVLPVIGGVLGAAGNGTPADALRRFARNPIFLALVAALVARLLPIPTGTAANPAAIALGEIASRTLGYLAQATTPLVLLALGAALRPRAAAGSARLLVLPCLLKLVVCPLAMWAACAAFGLAGDPLRVGVLQASMPTSVLCSLLCVQYEMDGALAGGMVFAATALSLLTIPLVQALLR
jgi:predicted permease